MTLPDIPPGSAKATEVAAAANRLTQRLFGPAFTNLGEIAGDWVRSWRMANLAAISQRVDRMTERRGLDPAGARRVALSVGLPLLEKASLEDDPFLQDWWAGLVAGAGAGADDEEGFGLDAVYVTSMAQLTRLDCEILTYVCERGVSHRIEEGGIQPNPLDPEDISRKYGQFAHIAVDKLVVLGLIGRVPKLPLTPGGPGGLLEVVIPSMIGLNLYAEATGGPSTRAGRRVREEPDTPCCWTSQPGEGALRPHWTPRFSAPLWERWKTGCPTRHRGCRRDHRPVRRQPGRESGSPGRWRGPAVGKLTSGDALRLRGGPRRFRRSAIRGTPLRAHGDSVAPQSARQCQRGSCRGSKGHAPRQPPTYYLGILA